MVDYIKWSDPFAENNYKSYRKYKILSEDNQRDKLVKHYQAKTQKRRKYKEMRLTFGTVFALKAFTSLEVAAKRFV